MRLHNDLVSRMVLSGKKLPPDMQYTDIEAEKLHDSIRESEDEDISDIEELTNKYLAQVRAKHG